VKNQSAKRVGSTKTITKGGNIVGAIIGASLLAALTACSAPVGGDVLNGTPTVTGEATLPVTGGGGVAAENASADSSVTDSGSGASGSDSPGTTSGNSATLPDQGGAVPLSVTSAETSLLVTGADDGPTDDGKFPYGQLKQPDLVRLLPSGLAQVDSESSLGLIATPTAKLTAAYKSPSDSGPIMALNQDTDMLLNMPAHWAVVGQQDGWVQILTPVGRGSLPSQDPSQVNHHTLWVKAHDVTLTPAKYRIEVDTENYTMTVTGPEGSNTFHIGVGKVGKTETPKGLCAIVGRVIIQTGKPGLLTNCQSEMIDSFEGAADAATAIHEYDPLGFDPAVGGAVSNGCMRVPDAAYEKYLADIPAGTPLIIK